MCCFTILTSTYFEGEAEEVDKAQRATRAITGRLQAASSSRWLSARRFSACYEVFAGNRAM